MNIGGWLNMEPFITPEYYEEFYPNAVDEWTLSQQLQAKYGNLDKIENHYKTFIVSLPHYLRTVAPISNEAPSRPRRTSH